MNCLNQSSQTPNGRKNTVFFSCWTRNHSVHNLSQRLGIISFPIWHQNIWSFLSLKAVDTLLVVTFSQKLLYPCAQTGWSVETSSSFYCAPLCSHMTRPWQRASVSMPLLLVGLWWVLCVCVFSLTQDQLWWGEAVDPTQLFLRASVCGRRVGWGWGREPDHDVSHNTRLKWHRWRVKMSMSVSFYSVLMAEWKVSELRYCVQIINVLNPFL